MSQALRQSDRVEALPEQERRNYTDQALAPAASEDLEQFEIFSHSESAQAAVRKSRAKELAKQQRRAALKASS